jgi:hypothetical protein
MAGITLAQAQEQLDAFMAANLAVSKGQSYTIDGLSLTRADSAYILKQIEFWDARVKALSKDSSSGPAFIQGIIWR